MFVFSIMFQIRWIQVHMAVFFIWMDRDASTFTSKPLLMSLKVSCHYDCRYNYQCNKGQNWNSQLFIFPQKLLALIVCLYHISVLKIAKLAVLIWKLPPRLFIVSVIYLFPVRRNFVFVLFCCFFTDYWLPLLSLQIIWLLGLQHGIVMSNVYV